MTAIDRSSATNFKVIFAITLVHFTGDFYSAFTSPLFPAFVGIGVVLGLVFSQASAGGRQ